MTVNLALEYIPRRMRELGYGDNYLIRFQVLNVIDGEQMILNAQAGEFYLLVEDKEEISIESETGYYELGKDTCNIQHYEHTGEIIITNNSSEIKSVRMIQVIPKHISKKCSTQNCK